MRAAWIEQGRVSLRDVPAPVAGQGEALVRVRLAGVCATDLELVRGYAGFKGVPGHELVGEVLSAPPGCDLVGARVVAEINAPCGSCATCRAGRPRHCPSRSVLGISGRSGAFAEEVALPVASLHRVPPSVADERAVFVEPLAAALEVLEQVLVRPGDRVLLLGAGRLGQLIARALWLHGCELGVVARHARQRELLAAHGVPLLDEAAVPRRSFDLVVEATGSPAGLELALQAVRPAGTLVLKSTYVGAVGLALAPIVVDEITIVGSRCGPFPPALRLLEAGLIDPTDLIDACLPLSKVEEAFALAAQPGALKVLLAPRR